MRIAIYYDVPFGGAHIAMEEILVRLQKNHQIQVFKNRPNTFNTSFLKRLWADTESIILQSFKQHQQAMEIDRGSFDLVFVSHDRHFQAPWILRFLKTPTVFLCQEPTRAFFEKFLDVDPSLPLINKIYERINRWIRKGIEIKNAQFATKTIANSLYSVESIFRAYGVTAIPVHLGVDTNIFKPQNLTKLNQVLIVGNDEPQKNLDFALRSLKRIDLKIRPTLVIACPRQNKLNRVLSLAKKFKVKVKLVTGLSAYELARVYNQSLATLATAHLEPFGLSVVESLACGVPVVAVCEGGFKETIVDGQNGLLSTRDPKTFALLIEKLLKDKSLRQKLSQNGPQSVRKNFTWEKTVSKIEKIFYHEVT